MLVQVEDISGILYTPFRDLKVTHKHPFAFHMIDNQCRTNKHTLTQCHINIIKYCMHCMLIIKNI